MMPELEAFQPARLGPRRVTLALIDIALFAAMCTLRGGDAAGSVTLEVTASSSARASLKPLDAVVEVLRKPAGWSSCAARSFRART
jgi:hypothetical protein